MESKLEWLLKEIAEYDERQQTTLERLRQTQHDYQQVLKDMEMMTVRYEMQQQKTNARTVEWNNEREQLLERIAKQVRAAAAMRGHRPIAVGPRVHLRPFQIFGAVSGSVPLPMPDAAPPPPPAQA